MRHHGDALLSQRASRNFYVKERVTLLRERYAVTDFVNDLQQYLSFFSDARDQKRIGEAAIWYLYSTRAAAEIKEFSPHAKVIAIIRNPADMIYSYHAQRLYNGNEDVSEFERALALEEERRCGRCLPADPHPLHGLS